ncbi:MAG: hypothetical protein IKS20_05020 [Victivallales bacterium]|nr:hypothetical protein [Victivallales bacterium]
MIHHIYIISLLLCLLLAGCGKAKAPDFDSHQSELVLRACEAIADGKDQDAMNVLNELRQYPATASFVEEAQLAIRRHYNSRQINHTLQTGDLKKLKQFLIEAEKQGMLSSEMLLNSDMPDALQALMLFCAKMPWENSSSLQNALAQLAPFVEPLSATEAFRQFYAEQRALLKKMEQEELQTKIDKCLATLDKAAATNDAKNWLEAHNELHKLKQDHPLFKYEMQLGKKSLDPNPDWASYAIALLGNWKRLDDRQRKTALDAMEGPPVNLCSNVLIAIRSNTEEALRAHQAAMEQLGLAPSNDVLMSYLGSLDIKYAEKGGTHSPCLGLKELFAIFSSINISPKTRR